MGLSTDLISPSRRSLIAEADEYKVARAAELASLTGGSLSIGANIVCQVTALALMTQKALIDDAMRTRDPLLRSRQLLLAVQAGNAVIKGEMASLELAQKEAAARRALPPKESTLAAALAEGLEMKENE